MNDLRIGENLLAWNGVQWVWRRGEAEARFSSLGFPVAAQLQGDDGLLFLLEVVQNQGEGWKLAVHRLGEDGYLLGPVLFGNGSPPKEFRAALAEGVLHLAYPRDGGFLYRNWKQAGRNFSAAVLVKEMALPGFLQGEVAKKDETHPRWKRMI